MIYYNTNYYYYDDDEIDLGFYQYIDITKIEKILNNKK